MVGRKLKFCIVTFILLNAVFLLSGFAKHEEKKEKSIMIKVDGFEVVYDVVNTGITTDDFRDIELGSSLDEIVKKLGEPDEWIGCGILWPVYFLEGKKAVALHFVYPDPCEDLWLIELFDENGESYIIKE